jgi:hypothetical protein
MIFLGALRNIKDTTIAVGFTSSLPSLPWRTGRAWPTKCRSWRKCRRQFYTFLGQLARSDGVQAGLDALTDEAAFTLGEGGEPVINQVFPRRGGVYALLQTLEADASLLQGGHHLDEVFQGAPQPVQFPHGQHVPLS